MAFGGKRLTSEEIDRYIQAGEIARRIRETFETRVTEGKKVLEFCEELEANILSRGASLAFPCNIGINEVAAHFTPVPSDETAFGPTDLVKVDYGLHLDGYLVDTAFTVALSKDDSRLVQTAELALKEVTKSIRAEDRISKIGKIVAPIARGNSYKIIENLQGHEIARYKLHAGVSIPNVLNFDLRKIKENTVVAIEPFLTYGFGAGRVVEKEVINIFQLPTDTRVVPSELSSAFDSLPLCRRWLNRLSLQMPQNLENRIKSYPVLVEANGAPIAQAETTLILLKDKTIDLVS